MFSIPHSGSVDTKSVLSYVIREGRGPWKATAYSMFNSLLLNLWQKDSMKLKQLNWLKLDVIVMSSAVHVHQDPL